MDTDTGRMFWIPLFIILLFAFGMRLVTLDHGLPDLQVGDENSDLSTALRLTEGELPARHVRYHRSLIAYVDGAAVAGLLGSEILIGNVRSIQDFRDLYFSDYDRFVSATRLMMALLTTLAILFAGLAGRVLNDRVGLLTAVVLSTNGFFLINSVFALPDGLVTFSVAFFMWRVMRVWKTHRNRDYFLAGLGLALIMLSKFGAMALVIGLVTAHTGIVWDEAGGSHGRFLRRLVLHPGVWWSVLGVILGNLLLNPLGFIYPNDLQYEVKRLSDYAYAPYEHTLSGQLNIIWGQIKDMTLYAWRWMLPTSLLGLLAALRWKRSVPYWIVIAAFMVLFVTFGRVISINYKIFFWVPWLIPMALLSAIGLDWLIELGSQRIWRVSAWGVAAVLLVLEGAFALSIIRIYERTDTRLQAQQYIEQDIPPGTPILTGAPLAYSVPLQRDETSITHALQVGAVRLESWDWWLDQAPDQRPGPAYDLYGPEYRRAIDSYKDLEQLISDNDIQYVIETDYCYGSKKPNSDAAIDFPVLSDRLRSQWELIRVFSPFGVDHCLDKVDDRTGLTPARTLGDQQRTGPIIRIYRVS